MDLHILGAITAAYSEKQAGAESLSSTVPDAVASAKRVEVNAETSRRHAITLFFDTHFRSAGEATQSIWPRAHNVDPQAWASGDHISLEEGLRTAVFHEQQSVISPEKRDHHKIECVSEMVTLLYVLDRTHSRFGRLADEDLVRKIARDFRLPDRIFSKGMWSSGVGQGLFGGTDGPTDGETPPAVRENYDATLDRYAGRTANPRQHEQGDPPEKEQLGNSLNLMEEIEVSTNAYVLNGARTAIEAIDWLPTGNGNMCCLIRSIVMLATTRWAVHQGDVTPETTEGKEAFKLDDLSPQDAASKYGELARNTDAVGQVLGILKFMKASATTLQKIATSKRDMGTVDFTAIIVSMGNYSATGAAGMKGFPSKAS